LSDGVYSVILRVSDGTYSAGQTFGWTINSPITLTAPADQTSNEPGHAELSDLPARLTHRPN
jgi:hypothetical protein